LALGGSALLTGALHEDGLADVADGFGGGRDVAAKLEIMRDSRLGTYGALALVVSFAAKLAALATIPNGLVVQSLISAHALGRGVLPWIAISLPYARKDGLAANAGKPDGAIAAVAAGLALLIAVLALPFGSALLAALAAGASALIMALVAKRQIGGQTGDVLGGAEQVAETAILVLLAARLG
ncbi:adenosylcobinamide-GDP ribazoletransferase, partial [Bradyrhizobium elkanii]